MMWLDGLALACGLLLAITSSGGAARSLMAIQAAATASLLLVSGLAAGRLPLVGAAAVVLAGRGVGLPLLLPAARPRPGASPTRPPPSGLGMLAVAAAVAGFTPLLARKLDPVLLASSGVGAALSVLTVGAVVALLRQEPHVRALGILAMDNGVALVAARTGAPAEIVLLVVLTLDLALVRTILVLWRGVGPSVVPVSPEAGGTE